MTFELPGAPATKGSARAYTVRKPDGRIGVRVRADNAALAAWEAGARRAALVARCRAEAPLVRRPQPVSIVAVFRLRRPQRLDARRYATGQTPTPPHTSPPDLDKLTRALGDALTGVLFEDDAQVVAWTVAKRYAGPAEPVGVLVTVDPAGSSPAVSEANLGPTRAPLRLTLA